MAKNFKDVQPGDLVLSLEMNRRTLLPLMEVCRVMRIGKEFTDKVGSGYGRLIKVELADSTQETFEVVLESETNTSIYDKVVYSTSPEVIYQEVGIQKQKAKAVIENLSKYKLCIEECDKIQLKLAPPEEVQKPQGSSLTNQDIQDMIKREIEASLTPMTDMVTKMYNSLMPNEPK